MVKLVCLECQKPIVGKRASKKYCSNACKQKAYRNQEELKDFKLRDGQVLLYSFIQGLAFHRELMVNEGVNTIDRFKEFYGSGVYKLLEQNNFEWDEELLIWKFVTMRNR